MATRLTEWTGSTRLREDEYVILRNCSECGEDGFVAIYKDACRYYVIHPALSGCDPSADVVDDILAAMDTERICNRSGSWAVRGNTIEDIATAFNAETEDDGDGPVLFDLDHLDSNSQTRAVIASPSVEIKDGMMLKGYREDVIYRGQGSYHDSHETGYNDPIAEMKEGQYRIGVELEICAKSARYRREIAERRSNWLSREHDSSLDSHGIELVTIPLLPKDAKAVSTWRPLVDYLTPRAESWSRDCCGLHVHIGREALGKREDERQNTIGKLLFLYYNCGIKDDPTNIKIFGRTRTYNEQSFRSKKAAAAMELGAAVLKNKEVVDIVDKDLKDIARATRYYDINLQNSATIEFRKGKGSINVERIISIITWCDEMVRYARHTDWANLSYAGLLDNIRRRVAKSNPIFRWLPTAGEEQ